MGCSTHASHRRCLTAGEGAARLQRPATRGRSAISSSAEQQAQSKLTPPAYRSDGPPRGPPRGKSRPDCCRSSMAERDRLSASSRWISSIVLGPSACTVGGSAAGEQVGKGFKEPRLVTDGWRLRPDGSKGMLCGGQSFQQQQHAKCCLYTSRPPVPQARCHTSLRGRQRLRRWSMRSMSMKRWRESRAASLRASCSMRVKYTFITSCTTGGQ